MRNFTLLSLMTAAVLTVSAAAPQQYELINPVKDFSERMMQRRNEIKKAGSIDFRPGMKGDSPAAYKNVRRMPAQPTGEEPIILTPPEGKSVRYVRSGVAVGVYWFQPIQQLSDGTVMDIVTTDDSKVYFNNPFSLSPVPGWVEGTISGSDYSFTFPQHVAHDEYDYGTPEDPDIEIYDSYAMVLEYVEYEDGGWFEICEDQTYKMTLGEDGVLVPENPELMIGIVEWIDNSEIDPESEAGWYWQIVGDTFTNLKPLTEKPLEIPEGLSYDTWALIIGTQYVDIDIAFKDDACYLKGLMSRYEGMEDVVIVGSVKDGKISFPTSQYLGVIEEYLCTSWFTTGRLVEVVDEDGPYTDFEYSDALVFDYDAEKKVMTTEGALMITTVPDMLLYFFYYDTPMIRKPDLNAKVTTLLPPEFDWFYEADEEFESPADLMFYLPMIDADYNVLDPEKYYWNLLIDGVPYEFASDEYVGLEEVFGPDYSMVDVPYGFNDGNSFWGMGDYQDVIIYAGGWDSLAVRALYKNSDTDIVYSPVVLMVGEDSVKEIFGSKEIVATSYFDLQGRKVAAPAAGLYIRADRMADGSMKFTKVMRR